MSTHAYKSTPRQVKEYIKDCLEADLVPNIESSPGLGKSSIVWAVAKEFNLKVIDHRLSTSAPEDLNGLADFEMRNGVRKAVFSPFDIFPIEGTPLPLDENGQKMNGWILFLDEFNAGLKSVQAAAYKTVLDKWIGQYKLHKACWIICAGNLATDRAIVNSLSTAMQSRLIHLEMELKLDKNGQYSEFMEDVAIPQKWDNRAVAYLNYMPSDLIDFNPAHNEKTFCCPRTWDFLQRLIKGKEFKTYKDEDGVEHYEMRKKAPLLAGSITSGKALTFIQFSHIGSSMPNIREILSDPENCRVPHEPEIRWCTITHAVEHVKDDTFQKIATYINRFESTFRVLFFRSLLVRQPTLRRHPTFASSMLELARYLND